ncbi:uncharacterized protein [Glycine max]|uniref:uncharacterized protein n=1 Tax=Glycine max TaxID=3847 RepID=UPI000233F3BF|nr:uncharacterized protein LOC100819608 [Glycine max]|eukprot:XP_003551363.1 uncharacterized protein LOC100819608 [Glycine max]
MKILEGNAGALTNFEVLHFLRAKGASKDPTRVNAKVAQFEYKVYDYLVDTAASIQTRESINELLTSVKQHDLAKTEVLNILNIGLAADFELYPGEKNVTLEDMMVLEGFATIGDPVLTPFQS